jgi:PatG C-terminal
LLGPDDAQWPAGAEDFLDRIYNEFRNTGVSPQDRALNYSAMNALNTNQIFKAEVGNQRRLDTVEVDKSTICRGPTRFAMTLPIGSSIRSPC